MTDMNNSSDDGNEIEQFPIEPRYHPIHKLPRKIYDFLASSKLAMLLLVVILICCLCGVTLYREQQATEMIFGTLWFNGLLVLLVANVACCFFGRIWGRRITVISFGMILFHLCFVAMFLAIVFNSLFSFNGLLRLTEGETLSNRDPKSYDSANRGVFFSYSRLKGETTLLRVHRGYKVNGEEKLIAYDISVADGGATNTGTIFINNKFSYKGIDYIRDREGYSLLVIINDRQGKELYGGHLPLQSLKQKDESYLYSTGTMLGPGLIDFPPEKDRTLLGLQLTYYPDSVNDRSGRIRFQAWPPSKSGGGTSGRSMADGSLGSGGAHTTNNAGGAHTMGQMADGAMNSAGGAHTGNNAGGGHTKDPKDEGAMNSAAGGKTSPPLADGTVNIAEKFAFGEHQLFAPEVRYWVAMNVRYNPGKPVVLASLWVGLAGMVITTIGRMMRARK